MSTLIEVLRAILTQINRVPVSNGSTVNVNMLNEPFLKHFRHITRAGNQYCSYLLEHVAWRDVINGDADPPTPIYYMT